MLHRASSSQILAYQTVVLGGRIFPAAPPLFLRNAPPPFRLETAGDEDDGGKVASSSPFPYSSSPVHDPSLPDTPKKKEGKGLKTDAESHYYDRGEEKSYIREREGDWVHPTHTAWGRMRLCQVKGGEGEDAFSLVGGNYWPG